jgi:hypothetical protein
MSAAHGFRDHVRIPTAAALAAAAALLVGEAASSSAADYCDGHIGQDFCLLEDKIPCHDSSCQVGGGGPTYACPSGDNVSACATRVAARCAAMPGCVAFGLCVSAECPNAPLPGQATFWVEMYNNQATAQPLDSGDWCAPRHYPSRVAVRCGGLLWWWWWWWPSWWWCWMLECCMLNADDEWWMMSDDDNDDGGIAVVSLFISGEVVQLQPSHNRTQPRQ